MPARYVHFSARDLEDAVLEIHGLKTATKAVDMPKIIQCPRCEAENPQGNVRCERCGYVLDRSLAMKIEEKERKREEEIIKA
ncbi:MAG: integrase, partial [Nitrososphaerota archaeon]